MGERESAPDIDNCIALANFYNVTLDDLVRYNSEKELLPIRPGASTASAW